MAENIPQPDFVPGFLQRAYVRQEQFLVEGLKPGANMDQYKASVERAHQDADKRILSLLEGDEEKRSAKESAFTAARDFWVKKLEEPGLSTNVASLGRGRITEITQQLEELNKPPQAPK